MTSLEKLTQHRFQSTSNLSCPGPRTHQALAAGPAPMDRSRLPDIELGIYPKVWTGRILLPTLLAHAPQNFCAFGPLDLASVASTQPSRR